MASDDRRVLTLAEVGKREFEVVARGVCYRYTALGVGLTLIFDRLRWKWDELHCELTVECALAGAQAVNGNVVSQASFNVSSDRARADRAARIRHEASLADIPLSKLVEDACQRVLQAERAATGVISLHDVADPDESAVFTCDGITIDLKQISMFYGLPGSGKSLQAERMMLELVRIGRRVGYVDFEWEPSAHKKRARQLYGPQFPDVRYIRLERPLALELDGLRRTAINDGWDFAVIDSVSFGVSGPLESAEVATAFLQACRQLRIGLLLVGHQSKADGGERHPFGSILWSAGARDIYHFRRSNAEHAADILIASVTHTKTNGSARRAPFAIEYTFGDRISIRLVNPAGIADLAPDLPIRQRLLHALRGGPRSIEDLAAELDVKPNSINQALSRDKEGTVKHFVRLGDARIGLVERSA